MSIPFQQKSQMIIAKIYIAYCEETTNGYKPNRLL